MAMVSELINTATTGSGPLVFAAGVVVGAIIMKIHDHHKNSFSM